MHPRDAIADCLDSGAMLEEHKQLGVISDFIPGSQDDMVNVLSVILGVAIASELTQ